MILKAYSSVVERAAHNGFVVGSNPTRPKLEKMYFKTKEYKTKKTKDQLKDHKLVFFFHSAKLNAEEWIKIEQSLKKLKLNYYKTLNTTAVKIFNNSIYKNFSSLICSTVLFVKPEFKQTKFYINSLEKELKPVFSLISVKLNGKIYPIEQVKNIPVLCHKTKMFDLYRTLDQNSKKSYILTK